MPIHNCNASSILLLNLKFIVCGSYIKQIWQPLLDSLTLQWPDLVLKPSWTLALKKFNSLLVYQQPFTRSVTFCRSLKWLAVQYKAFGVSYNTTAQCCLLNKGSWLKTSIWLTRKQLQKRKAQSLDVNSPCSKLVPQNMCLMWMCIRDKRYPPITQRLNF